jgi:hypothetical protein
VTPRLLAVAALLATAAPPASAQEKELLFDAPTGANDKDRSQAARALAARCVAGFGMAGVTGDTVRSSPTTPRQIRLLSPQGFTPEQILAVLFLASMPCRQVHLRLEHFLNKEEKEKFGDGLNSPKAMTWTKVRCWALLEKPFRRWEPEEKEIELLFRDKPVIEAAGKWSLLRHPGGDLYGYDREPGIYMTFKGAIVKTMHDGIVPDPEKPGKTILPLNLFIDGFRFPTEGGSMGWRTLQPNAKDPDLALWTFPDLTEKSLIGHLLENPLPFALTRSP